MALPESPFVVLYAVAGLGLAVMWSRARRCTPVAWCFCGVWAHEDVVREPRTFEQTSVAV